MGTDLTTTAKPSRIARNACETSTVNSASVNSSSTLGNFPARTKISHLQTMLDLVNKNCSNATSNSRKTLSTREKSSTRTSTLSGRPDQTALTTETQTTAHPTAASQSSTCAAEAMIDPTTGSASTRTSAALKVNPAELSLQMSPAKHLEKLISHSRKYSSESILLI